jgi:hypothetical protein
VSIKLEIRDGRECKIASLAGKTVVIIGKELRPNVKTPFGVSEAYKADVADLTGGILYEDTLIFAKVVVKQLKEADDALIGTMQRHAIKDSDNSYYAVEDPTHTQLVLAASYGF